MKLPSILILTTVVSACSSMGTAPSKSLLGPEFTAKPEIERLRYFKEVNAVKTLNELNLTGKNVHVTIMGEMVDASHPDLDKTIQKQYNAFSFKDEIRPGPLNQPIGEEQLGPNDGHGTHIAGTIAAACDGRGVQGLACEATLDVYNLGAYDNIERFPSENWENTHEFERFISAFSSALLDVAERRSSRIVTGSFNLESPAIQYSPKSQLSGRSATSLVNELEERIDSIEDLFTTGLAVIDDPAQRQFLERVVEQYDEPSIAIMSLLPLSSTWSRLEDAIASYQKNDGVYLVTESNFVFDDHTSTLNAMPTLSDKVDPELWLSVVMAVPEGMSSLTQDSSEADVDKIMLEAAYTTPLNSCGSMAQDYCILTPSYSVLSTMTERVAFWGASPLFDVDGRLHQVLDGHSMGAPMVAAALALMEENNQKNQLGYTMKNLVKILKDNARRDFPGYNPVKHGQGLLNVDAAIDAM